MVAAGLLFKFVQLADRPTTGLVTFLAYFTLVFIHTFIKKSKCVYVLILLLKR